MNSVSYPIVRAFTSIAACIILLCAGVEARAAGPAPTPALPAAPVPGQIVGFENTQGKALFLHDFKGKPVLINLWATWCAPCVKEMPSLAKLQKDYAATGLVVIAISEDETMPDVLAFYKKNSIIGLEPYLDKGHGVYTALTPRGLPTTILVNRDGVMVQRVEGPVEWQAPQALSVLTQILKK